MWLQYSNEGTKGDDVIRGSNFSQSRETENTMKVQLMATYFENNEKYTIRSAPKKPSVRYSS